jgi:hypothetical protein
MCRCTWLRLNDDHGEKKGSVTFSSHSVRQLRPRIQREVKSDISMAETRGRAWPLADAELTNSVSLHWHPSSVYSLLVLDLGARPTGRQLQTT